MNLFGAMIFGTIAFALVGDFLDNGAATKAGVNCDTSCDSKIELSETLFLLIIPIGVGVVAGIIPPPNQWFRGIGGT